jgi:hypothetical protein
LRSAETERLAQASEKIHKAVAELARIDASAGKHVAAAAESLVKLQHAAQTGAQQLAQQSEASAAQASQQLGASVAAAQTALDGRLAALDAVVARLAQALLDVEKAKAEQPTSEPSTPRKPRKAKQDSESTPPVATEAPPPPAEPLLEVAPAAEPLPAPEPLEEPVIPAVPEPVPVVVLAPEPVPEPVPMPSFALAPETPSAPPESAPDEFSQAEPGENALSTSLSADGATRLIVTAYIGIGNRLFIRGSAPGLSWEKGHPLQFVSIGKWRWESAEVTEPVKIKLLKNDQTECASLGELTLAPGHQAEVTANF